MMNTIYTKVSGRRARHRVLSKVFAGATAILAFTAGPGSQAWATAGTQTAANSSTPPSPALMPVGGVPAIPKGALALGALPARENIRVDIALKPRNSTALGSFVSKVSTPGSPLFHKYLAPGQFGSIFGATASAVDAVRGILARSGLHLGATTSNGLLIPVQATARQLEAAFHTKLQQYRLSSGRIAYANTAPPVLPQNITGYVQGVIGLNSLVLMKPVGPSSVPSLKAASPANPINPTSTINQVGSQSRPRTALSSYQMPPPSPQATTGPQPCTAAANVAQSPPQVNGYPTPLTPWTANEVAAAYGFTGAYAKGALGAGQTIALFEQGTGFSQSDISTYEQCYGINTTVNTISVDGGATPTSSTNPANGEADEDIEIAAGLDPNATIDVYQAPDGATASVDIFNQIATDDKAQVVSVSYGYCEQQVTAGNQGSMSTEKTLSTIMQQMAAQGQTVLIAAGDTGSETCMRGEQQGPFDMVSCAPGSSFCLASDMSGNSFTFNGSGWSFAGNPTGTPTTGGIPLGVSCVSATWCMGISTAADAYIFNGSSWSAPQVVHSYTNNYPLDLSCASQSFCMMVDTAGNTYMYNGSSWVASGSIDGGIPLMSVSCPSSTFCAAVDKGDDSFFYNGSSWSAPVQADYQGSAIYLTSISCPSSSFCAAVDNTGSSNTYENGSWGYPTMTDSDGGGFAIATTVDCLSSDFCVAVDSNGYVYVQINGQIGSKDVDGSTKLTSVSCASENFCVAVDTNGNAIFDNGSGPSAPQPVDIGNASLSVNALASTPYDTAVGGTTLESDSYPPQEKVWNNGFSTNGGGAGGGGISAIWQMPSWQQASGVPGVISSLSTGAPCGVSSGNYCREMPDVAASADWYQGGYVLYGAASMEGTWGVNGGTSGATPTWASLIALANEVCGTKVGFADPLLYKIAAQDPSAFNNITSGNNDYTSTNGGLYPAASGSQHYSMADGLGSPNGPKLISDICNASTPVPAPTVTSVTPSSGSTAGGTVVTITGTNFTSYSMVDFGTISATSVSVKSSTLLTAVSPAGSPGMVSVTVTNSGGTSKPAGFVYITPNIPYTPITPYRIADTRCAESPPPAGITSTYCSALPAANQSIVSPPSGGSITIQVAGTGSGANAVPATAQSVELNVTAIASPDAHSGYLTVYPAGTRVPEASSVNYIPGTAVPNLVTAALGESGMVSIYSSSSDVNIVVDVEGYYEPNASTPNLFNPLPLPVRLLDTRCSTTPQPTFCSSENLPVQNNALAAPEASGAIAVTVAGLDNVPAGASAVSAVLTAADSLAPGYLTAWPDSGSCSSPPAVSNVNFAAGQSVANSITVEAGSSGKICVYNGSSVPVNVVIDLNGYYSSTGDTFTPSSPVRICDTRLASTIGGADVSSGISGQCANSGQSLDPSMGTSDPITVHAGGLAGIPSTAVAVVANITVVSIAGSGYLTAWPEGSKQPETSNINWRAGEVVPNMVTVALSSSGAISVYASANADIIVDVMGYYSSSGSGSGG